MVLEQNNFCTRKVSFHRVGIEVILQTILPMDLCSPIFFHPGLCPEMTQFLQRSTYLTLKNKIPSMLVEDGQWYVRRWGRLLSSLFPNLSEPGRFRGLCAEEQFLNWLISYLLKCSWLAICFYLYIIYAIYICYIYIYIYTHTIYIYICFFRFFPL